MSCTNSSPVAGPTNPESPAASGGVGAPTRKWRAGGSQIVPRPPGWLVGRNPAWLGSDRTFDVAQIVQALARRGSAVHDQQIMVGAKSSAVLVALVDGDDGAEVLLTRRSWDLRTHRGEVSFPGGRRDPNETVVQAALREAHEEVALDPAMVTVIGELDHLSTFVTNSHIVPVVAGMHARPELRPSAAEVERIFYVSLNELTRVDTHREERWGDHSMTRRLHFFELDDETIWGATARILVNLLDIVWAS
jgi:8-oxo-dGTP pyrophosphatase MutT (NUDIX family)